MMNPNGEVMDPETWTPPTMTERERAHLRRPRRIARVAVTVVVPPDVDVVDVVVQFKAPANDDGAGR